MLAQVLKMILTDATFDLNNVLVNAKITINKCFQSIYF